ncbi:hypothetical protein ACF1A9_22740 [Streptomyces sp. NPDC014872]|uniref:hypothetical protein n=1 Tax=Streptomyces sp. NPDC014872 TaxID=3364926 RepID=UPI0036F6DE8D
MEEPGEIGRRDGAAGGAREHDLAASPQQGADHTDVQIEALPEMADWLEKRPAG